MTDFEPSVTAARKKDQLRNRHPKDRPMPCSPDTSELSVFANVIEHCVKTGTDPKLSNLGWERVAAALRASQPATPDGNTVTVKVPEGYASVWDFLNDCGLESVQPATPTGGEEWKLVPIEPTQAMIGAAEEAREAYSSYTLADSYREMVQAAPARSSAGIESGDAQIRRAAKEAAPHSSVVRSDGDLLVYYAGFNLSKFVRFLALQPHVVGASDDAQAAPAITDEMVQLAAEIYSEVYIDDDKDQGDAIRAVLAYALSSMEGKTHD